GRGGGWARDWGVRAGGGPPASGRRTKRRGCPPQAWGQIAENKFNQCGNIRRASPIADTLMFHHTRGRSGPRYSDAGRGLMQRPLMVLIALAAAAILAPAVAAEGAVCIENATIDDLHGALASCCTGAAALARGYTARTEAYDRAGPRLNAVRELNPDAAAVAATIDARKSGARRPLEGIPVLLKDNIATGDAQ